MNELELLQQQVKLLQKENEVLNKTVGMEFEKIAKAFSQMGNLVDLLYLEVSVLVETIAGKGLFTQEEFTAKLEETAKRIEEDMKKAAEEPKTDKPQEPSVEKI